MRNVEERGSRARYIRCVCGNFQKMTCNFTLLFSESRFSLDRREGRGSLPSNRRYSAFNRPLRECLPMEGALLDHAERTRQSGQTSDFGDFVQTGEFLETAQQNRSFDAL